MPDRAAAAGETRPADSYPNKLGRIILMASEEVLGRNGLKAILAQARLQHLYDSYPPNNLAQEFSFDQAGSLFQALDEMYGRRTGRRLARRIGQRCFAIGLRQMHLVHFLSRVAFRLLPPETRMRVALEVGSRVVGKLTGHPVRLRENDGHYYCSTRKCGFCRKRRCGSPCCDVVAGILQETVGWIDTGSDFSVRETTCIGAGQPVCTFEIAERSVD
jgi:hypothetical protein